VRIFDLPQSLIETIASPLVLVVAQLHLILFSLVLLLLELHRVGINGGDDRERMITRATTFQYVNLLVILHFNDQRIEPVWLQFDIASRISVPLNCTYEIAALVHEILAEREGRKISITANLKT
jgi:hypothetical protein